MSRISAGGQGVKNQSLATSVPDDSYVAAILWLMNQGANRSCGRPSSATYVFANTVTASFPLAARTYNCRPPRPQESVWVVRATTQEQAGRSQASSTRSKMSNHLLLKPSSSASLSRENDFRITGPNVAINEIPEVMKKDCLLFYYPDCKGLASRIAEVGGGNVELAEINWRRFADGFPNLYVRDAIRIRNRHVAFLASFHDPGVIFEQISIIYQLPRLFVGSFTLVLPYFPTGTAERVEAEGDVATAFTLARIISNIPLARGGPASVVIFDIHALQERFYFGDQVLPLFESGIPLLRERLQQLPDATNITIAYPDEGAWKRFHYQFGDYPEVICTKVRDGDKRIVRLKEGVARDRHVVIVDDLVQSGSTLIECQKLLATQGAAHVSAYVTHGVFPNESWKRFDPEGPNGAADGFRYFWISDSCPKTVDAVTDREPFEVLSLAEPIAAALQI